MVDDMSMIWELYAQYMDLSPAMVGLEDCERLLARLKNKKITPETFPVRHFLAIQQALEPQELDYVYGLPGCGSPADGLKKTRRDMAPLLRLLESGAGTPGALRPLTGAAACGNRIFVFWGFANSHMNLWSTSMWFVTFACRLWLAAGTRNFFAHSQTQNGVERPFSLAFAVCDYVAGQPAA